MKFVKGQDVYEVGFHMDADPPDVVIVKAKYVRACDECGHIIATEDDEFVSYDMDLHASLREAVDEAKKLVTGEIDARNADIDYMEHKVRKLQVEIDTSKHELEFYCQRLEELQKDIDKW